MVSHGQGACAVRAKCGWDSEAKDSMNSKRANVPLGAVLAQPSATSDGDEVTTRAADGVVENASSSADLCHVVIQPESGFELPKIGELWQYRELIWLLAARDLKIRYRQSLLGIAWSLMQPFFVLVAFVVFFTFLGQTPVASGVPYTVSLLCGIVLWNFFSSVLNSAANSLSQNVHLITKVYCPRLVFPLSSVVVGLVDLAVSLVALAAVLAWYRILPGVNLLLLPGFVAMAGVVALAIGLCMAALSIRWRDIRFTIPVLLQMGFFFSPVFYETGAMIPERFRTLFYLNPMAGVLDGFGSPGFAWSAFAASGPLSLAMLFVAFYLFRRVERTLPDYL
jgi:lipopolysaccharide transport system permease protein